MNNDKVKEEKPKEEKPKIDKAALKATMSIKQKQLSSHKIIEK